MSPRRVAVLGSNSFSGSDFVDHLLGDGTTEVLGISRTPEKGRLFLPYLERRSSRYRFAQADFNQDMDRLVGELDAFAPAAIVNFAALSDVASSWTNPEHYFQTNTVSLAMLVNALKERSYLRRYVHISSPEAYGSCTGKVLESAPLAPSTPYAASKAAADLLLATYRKHHDFPLITVRSTNVYGAYQQLFKIIPRTVIRLRLNQKIELHGAGVAVKSFVHIRDVSRGEEAIMERGRIGEVYHLSPDRGYAVRDIVDRICTMLGRSFERSTCTVAERLGQDAAHVIDSTKVRTELGWLPRVSIDEGLSGVLRWVETYWEDIIRQPHDYMHSA